jgi:hypothetical protein
LNPGSANPLPQFSAATLQQATVNGQPLAPGASSSSVAAAAVSGIGSALSVGSGGSQTGGWMLDLRDRTKPRFRSHATDGAFRAARAAEGVRDDGIWSELEQFADDVWEGIKNGVIAVTQWVVDAANALVTLTVEIAGAVQTLADLALSGIETIVSVVQSIFVAVGALVADLVSWLLMEFGWDAVWNTKLALESAVTQAFPAFLAIVQGAQPQLTVKNFFTGLQSQISSAFNAISTQYTGTVGATLATPGGDTSSADLLMSMTTSVQGSWFFDKATSTFSSTPGFALYTSTGVGASLTAFTATVTSAWVATLESAVSGFNTFLTTTLNDPSQFASVVLATLLGEIKTLVIAILAFLDAVIEALLSLAIEALNAVANALASPVTYPFLLGVMQEVLAGIGVTLPAPTILDIVCFALAVPVTLYWGIAYGTQPFPGGTYPPAAPAAEMYAARLQPPSSTQVAGVAALVWMGFDAALDALTDAQFGTVVSDLQQFFGAVGLVVPVAINALTWPGTAFSAPPTSAQGAAFIAWCAGWGPPVLDACSLLTDGTLARYVDPVGKLVMSSFGAVWFAANIFALFSGTATTTAGVVSSIAAPLSTMTQFLRLDPQTPQTTAIKVAIDFVGDGANAVAMAVS